MAFAISSLGFFDSMQFLNSSLDALVKSLSDNDFKYLTQVFSGDLLELVKQKGVYLYQYVDSFEKFAEDKFPNKSKCYVSFRNGINEEGYLHTIDVWNKFKKKSLGKYHDNYLKMFC